MSGSRAKKLRKEAKAFVIDNQLKGSNAVAVQYKRIKKDFKLKSYPDPKIKLSRRQERMIVKSQNF